MQEQVSPLQRKILSKKADLDRTRKHGEDEAEKLAKDSSSFSSDVNELRKLNSQIEEFEESSAPDEQARIETKMGAVQEKMSQKNREIDELLPRLEETKNAVQDQERYKNQLTQNIEIVKGKKRIKVLNRDIAQLQDNIGQIEGYDTAHEKWDRAKAQRDELMESKFRSEGRFSEIVEQIRATKVRERVSYSGVVFCLSFPTYSSPPF